VDTNATISSVVRVVSLDVVIAGVDVGIFVTGLEQAIKITNNPNNKERTLHFKSIWFQG
jgi:hypothetical protein